MQKILHDYTADVHQLAGKEVLPVKVSFRASTKVKCFLLQITR